MTKPSVSIRELLDESLVEQLTGELAAPPKQGVLLHRIALAAACLLVFSLLYTPCVAAIASIKRELGTRWAVAVVVWQCALAWAAASIVHLIGLLLGVGL